MALRMPVVFTERHVGHAPDGGYWLGVELPGDEEPERGEALRRALVDDGNDLVEAVEHGDEALLRVHTPDFVDFLSRAHRDWLAAGHDLDPGQARVVPYVFPLPQLTSGRPAPRPSAIRAEVGRYAIDTMTLISAGTYDAARAAVDASLTAADRVLAGAPAAYAAVRPPGHHAGADFYGGSCYLNNAAAAAAHLRAGGVRRVAVVDIDAHHGNGTQEIFYDDPTVLYASVHVDPGAGWFPHFVGFGDERGAGPGKGANLNLPLAPGTGDGGWLATLDRALDAVVAHGSEAIVVSLGVDAATDDPESPLLVTAAGYAEAGRRLASLARPTMFVQEGGYDLARFGALVLAVLHAFEQAAS